MDLRSKSSHPRRIQKLIKSLNIYHQAERIQKWEVNDPNRTSFELPLNRNLELWAPAGRSASA